VEVLVLYTLCVRTAMDVGLLDTFVGKKYVHVGVLMASMQWYATNVPKRNIIRIDINNHWNTLPVMTLNHRQDL
jgi:hypothetical protein